MKNLPRLVLTTTFLFFASAFLTAPASASEYSWEHLYTFPSRVQDFDSDPFEASVLYAGLWNGLHRSEDGGLSWSRIGFEDRNVSTLATHPQDSSIIYIGAPKGIGESGLNYKVYRFSVSDGSSSPILESGSAIGQIYIDRIQPRVIYAAIGGRIHRSYDGGESWAVGAPVPYLHEFAVSSSDFFEIYAAAGTCGLYKSDDGGASWTGGRSRCDAFTTRVENVAADPFDENPPIFTLTGGGPTFPSCLYPWMGEGVGEALHRNCMAEDAVFNPFVRNEIFLAAVDQGGRRFVKRSPDFGEAWLPFEEGLPSAYPGPGVTEFFIHKAVPYLYAVVGFNDLYWAQVGEILEVNRPVILAPGMGASFNPSLFFGHGPDNWAFTPGVHVYDGLLESFENAGYVRDRNLFVAFYDWRAPMRESSCEYLKPVVEEALALSGADKVWLVGHSQGGLVGRAYIQGDCYGGDVEKLVTLGTPHMGTTDAYFAWEGGKFRGYDGFARVGIDFLLAVLRVRHKLPSSFQVIQQEFRSLKEILPVYDFLKRNETVLAWSSLHEINDFLPDLNIGLSDLIDSIKVTTISGDKNDTSKFIKVNPRPSWQEELWVDGQPVELNPIEFGDGDGRVLKSSSLVNGSTTQIAEGLNHGELVGLKAGQKKLFASLGIELEDSQYVESPPFDAILGFFLGSPATLLITDLQGNKVGYDLDTEEYVNELGADVWGEDQEEKWIVIPNPDSEEYVVQVFPLGDGGVYHLFASYESDQSQGQEETIGEVLGGEEPDGIKFILSPANDKQPIQISDPNGEIALGEITAQSGELRDLIKSWGLRSSVKRLLIRSLNGFEEDAKTAQRYFKGGNFRKSEAYMKFAITRLEAFKDIANSFYSRGLLTEEQINIINFYLEGVEESLLS